MKVRGCILQFEREADFTMNVEKARKYLKKSEDCDIALIGGEYSVRESSNTDPYPPLIDLAKSFRCNTVAPVNANLRRFPNLAKREKGYSSMHIFNREGEVIAIQDKQHFYPKEAPWFRKGTDVRVFNIDGVKVGLLRGLDISYPEYTQRLKGVELLFFSTMATDDMMLELAKARSLEHQCYVLMSSFIGKYAGMNFLGNAAVIEPVFRTTGNLRADYQPKILRHLTQEGMIEADLDIDCVRKIKKKHPI